MKVNVTINSLIIHGYDKREAAEIASDVEAALRDHLLAIDHPLTSRAESSRSITVADHEQLGRDIAIAITGPNRGDG